MLVAGAVGALVALLATDGGVAPDAAPQSTAACDAAAVRQGGKIDLGALKQFVARGCDIDTIDRGGKTLLSWSVHDEQWKATLWLVEHGADFKRAGHDGDSILHEIVMESDDDIADAIKIVDALARRGADMDVVRYRQTALHRAADYPRMLRALLAHGANPNLADGFGMTPLFTAASRSRWGDVRALLAAGAHPTGRDENEETIWYLLKDPAPDIVRQLLLHGADVNERNRNGDGPLHVLTEKSGDRRGLVAVTKLLIARGADPRATNDQGETPLHVAASEGFIAMARLLIAARAPVEAKDKDGQTPLQRAGWMGHADMVALLLGHGAAADGKDASGLTSLHWLARGRFGMDPPGDWTRTVRLLVSHGAKVDEPDHEGRTPLWHAMGDLPRLQLLLSQGARRDRPSPRGASLFHLAIYRDQGEVVWGQLAPGATTGVADADGRMPLHWAAFFGRTQAAIRLINASYIQAKLAGVDITIALDAADGGGRTALDWAIAACQRPVAALLLRQGARPTSADWRRRLDACPERPEQPPIDERLHEAAAKGDTKLVKELLDRGLPIDGRDSMGQTPLHRASALDWVEGATATVQALLGRGAKVGAVDREGRTPLHMAARGLNVAVARILLKAGADVNATDDRGRTPLHLVQAKHSGSFDLYRLLIDGGAKLSARDRMGRTPLHAVCDTDDAGAAAAAELFICRGADPDARDSFGWTASDIARMRSWPNPTMPRCPATASAPSLRAR